MPRIANTTKTKTGDIREACLFQNRGLSYRTIKALIICAINAPEHLLFMKEDDLRNIRGVGKVALTEIKNYRLEYCPPSTTGMWPDGGEVAGTERSSPV